MKQFSLLLAVILASALPAWARGGGGCFLPGTPVLLADLSEKAVEAVQPGDEVLGFDPLAGMTTAKVTAVYTREVDGYLELQTQSTALKTTVEHPFYVGDGRFKTAGTLHPGDTVFQRAGTGLTPCRILALTAVNRPVTVYNLQTDGPHTYFASGILVHNKGGGGGGGHGGGGGFYGGGGGYYGGSGGGGDLLSVMVVLGLSIGGIAFVVWVSQPNRQGPGRPASSAAGSDPLDQTVSHHRASERDNEVRTILAELQGKGQIFDLDILGVWAGETFRELQRCWELRDYGPMKHRMTPTLFQQHTLQVDGLRRTHEINRVEGLAIDNLWFFRVTAKPGRNPEITVLFEATARDYYVSDRNGRFLRGDAGPRSFQEFWVFRHTAKGWRLAAIDQVSPGAKAWKPHVYEVSPPDLTPVATEEISDEEVGLRFTLVCEARAQGSLEGLDAGDFTGPMWAALGEEFGRSEPSIPRPGYRNLCVRSVEPLKSLDQTRGPTVKFRVEAHAQGPSGELEAFEERWTLVEEGARWKVADIKKG